MNVINSAFQWVRNAAADRLGALKNSSILESLDTSTSGLPKTSPSKIPAICCAVKIIVAKIGKMMTLFKLVCV